MRIRIGDGAADAARVTLFARLNHDYRQGQALRLRELALQHAAGHCRVCTRELLDAQERGDGLCAICAGCDWAPQRGGGRRSAAA